jgi:hypothetical protein
VGRIESGAVDPRFETLMTLLRACGYDLEVEPRLGVGVDRSQLRELLKLTPEQRIRNAATAARGIAAFLAAREVGGAKGKSARSAA